MGLLKAWASPARDFLSIRENKWTASKVYYLYSTENKTVDLKLSEDFITFFLSI